MKLFDDIGRDNLGYSPYSDPTFTFLNDSARPAVARIRQTLEDWFSHCPLEEQAELRTRFRSTNDVQHNSAFLELFLHELLSKLGCRVLIHPKLSQDTSRRPDFLVECSRCGSFYLEAAIATGESNEERAASARKDVVYDALNWLDSPNFFIGMNLRGAPATSPPGRRIPELAGRYKYPNEDRMPEIGLAARARGYFTKDEFRELCRWKTLRSQSRVSANPTKLIEEATRVALASPFEELRVGVLTLLHGVSWPTASAVLHFAHTEPYPIIDVRALWLFGADKEPTYYYLDYWLDYVDVCRKLAKKNGMPMRILDRALWQYPKENQPPR